MQETLATLIAVAAIVVVIMFFRSAAYARGFNKRSRTAEEHIRESKCDKCGYPYPPIIRERFE